MKNRLSRNHHVFGFICAVAVFATSFVFVNEKRDDTVYDLKLEKGVVARSFPTNDYLSLVRVGATKALDSSVRVFAVYGAESICKAGESMILPANLLEAKTIDNVDQKNEEKYIFVDNEKFSCNNFINDRDWAVIYDQKSKNILEVGGVSPEFVAVVQ